MSATRAFLPDGRLHLQHGPIDCVIGADGEHDAVRRSHALAWDRFQTILPELVAELPTLHQPVGGASTLRGSVARRMWRACAPHRARFVTSMAAVAGAVADELIEAYRRPGIARAWINNGGDIALHLADGEAVSVGLFADLGAFAPHGWNGTVDIDGRFRVAADTPVRGIATSGWRGRSFSLGIADSVTVLAASAAEADAAATMIANAVDLDDARIVRRPASSLKDDTDLGDRLVTVDVPRLEPDLVDEALRRGLAHAESLRASERIVACFLTCQGRAMRTATPALPASTPEWHSPRFASRILEQAA